MTARIALCIDDDPRMRDTVRTVMARAGWDVWEAESGRRGLELAGEGPDVVILDVRLPDTHGFEVCKQLKADARTAHIPVLHLSGEETDDAARAAGLEGGADAYLVKPVSGKVLLATVNALDRMARAERSLAAALREAEVAHAAKDRFLAGMTDKLRLPLNTAIAAAGDLLESALTPRQRDLVDRVKGSAERLMILVNNILDATRLDARDVELEESEFNIRDVVRDTVAMVREQRACARTEVALEYAQSVPRTLRTDAGRLAQVLFHVVAQAVARAVGGVVVSVALSRDDGEAGRLDVDVRHDGAPVPAAQRDHLFTPLDAIEAAPDRDDVASVSGLAVSASVVAILGGGIGYREHENGGGVYWFYLPVGCVAAEAAGAAVSDAGAGGSPTGLRVLVVDDNSVNRKVAAGILRKLGVDVTLAEDGAQAVARTHETAFDLVLMDLQMPGMDGFEATRRIRAAADGATAADVRIVALTAQSDDDSTGQAHAAGVNDYVVKPLSKAALERILAGCPGRAAAAEAGGTEPGVFRVDVLLERLDGDREVMEEVLDLFLAECPADLQRAVTAVESGDWEQAARAAHALKGAAANVGADRLSAAAAELETRSRSSDAEGAAQCLADVRAAFESARQAMLRYPRRGSLLTC